MKIVITDAQTVCDDKISLDSIKEIGETVIYPLCSAEELPERIKDADIVICNKSQMTAEVLKSAQNLKYIGLFATGYNNIDLDYTNAHGITVCNVPGYSTEAVAQHTFALILALLNRVGEYNKTVLEGDWIKSQTFSYFPLPLLELSGKTIGIVGYGSIGRQVARIAKAFNMNVLVLNRSKISDSSVFQVDFDTLLRESDIVTLHCPLNADSADMMNGAAFRKMKKGAYFINTARGPLVDEFALKTALECGHLAGAGLDVLRVEPMTEDCPLYGIENCLITPHIAWAGVETRTRLMDIVCENIKAYLRGEPQNVVR
ncbi:MAG: D-2-hydroxyacid dehydrogenase [Ruminococcaceae bacterium]|nr:D-2-hydroxyacid dehydrogenase [Oscillospiraceae bacterium]